MTTALVTGGAGFVGHHLCQFLLDKTDWHVVAMDRDPNPARVALLRGKGNRFSYIERDFSIPPLGSVRFHFSDIEYIFHVGAEAEVAKSLENAEPFAKVNVLGTLNLLELARQIRGLKRFLYLSTNEVFGPVTVNEHGADQPVSPRNPYGASKAAGEMFVTAYQECHKVPANIVRTQNVFGEYQTGSKFIPSTVRKIQNGETVTVDGGAPRRWIHARQLCTELVRIAREGESGKIYHVAGEALDTATIAGTIAELLGKPLDYVLVPQESQRPGHNANMNLAPSREVTGVLEALQWTVRQMTEEKTCA